MNGRLYILQILCRQKREGRKERGREREGKKERTERDIYDVCVCATPIFHHQCFRVDLNNTATTRMWAWTVYHGLYTTSKFITSLHDKSHKTTIVCYCHPIPAPPPSLYVCVCVCNYWIIWPYHSPHCDQPAKPQYTQHNLV